MLKLPKTTNSPAGFTIIETTIVLAIAALIMTVVFLAVPGLNRSSRDNTRKAIAARLKSEIENYTANHGGTQPFENVGSNCAAGAASEGDWADFYNKLTANINDPGSHQPMTICAASPTASSTSDPYIIQANSGDTLSTVPDAGIIDIVTHAQCNGAGFEYSGVANSYAVIVGLEGGGGHTCIDNR